MQKQPLQIEETYIYNMCDMVHNLWALSLQQLSIRESSNAPEGLGPERALLKGASGRIDCRGSNQRGAVCDQGVLHQAQFSKEKYHVLHLNQCQ